METFILNHSFAIISYLLLLAFNLGAITVIIKSKPSKEDVEEMILLQTDKKINIAEAKEIVAEEMNNHISVCPFSKTARDKFFPLVDGTELKADMKNLKEDVREIKQDIKHILEKVNETR